MPAVVSSSSQIIQSLDPDLSSLPRKRTIPRSRGICISCTRFRLKWIQGWTADPSPRAWIDGSIQSLGRDDSFIRTRTCVVL